MHQVRQGGVCIEDILAMRLAQRALIIFKQFSSSGRTSDLDTAAMLLHKALNMLRAEHPLRRKLSGTLASVLGTRFEHTRRDFNDLQDCITLNEEILRILPATHPDRLGILDNLATGLWARFEQKGRVDDLDGAILLRREALALVANGHPARRFNSLKNLADALSTRFERNYCMEDLKESISLYRQAITLLPPHPGRAPSLINLADALSKRFEQQSLVGDLEEAILLYREALILFPAPNPDRPSLLNNLAIALLARFKHVGHTNDLEETILLHREALMLRPAPNPDSYRSLDNLAIALLMRFGQKGQVDDLEEVILLQREALILRPTQHSEHFSSLNNLADALSTRFDQKGQVGDLEEAISLYREALQLSLAPHPDMRSSLLANLAISLSTRFKHKHQVDDLDEAILLLREALKLRPALHSDRSTSLDNLAGMLSIRFKQKDQVGDLEEAILLHREALTIRPAPHPYRSCSLSNLAVALWTRYARKDQTNDLEEAILLHREAISLHPTPHPDRPSLLSNFAMALSTRFERSGQVDDLEEAIVLQQEALALLPASHPARCFCLATLASYLCQKSRKLDDQSFLDIAMHSFHVTMTSEPGPLLDRLNAAQVWAMYADNAKHVSAMEAYQAAIQLLPQVAMLASDINSRHRLLADRLGPTALANRAAACAIRLGQFEQAVEILEGGRSIFWTHALQLRTSFDDLQQSCPELAQHLRDVSRALEQSSFPEISRMAHDDVRRAVTTEAKAVQFRQLSDDWVATLDRVRALEGFDDFLCPKKFRSLKRAASHGPIVLVNAAMSSCDALIITSTGVEHVRLSTKLTSHDIAVLANSIHCASTGRLYSFAEEIQAPLENLVKKVQVARDPVLMTQDRRAGRRRAHKIQNADDIFRNVLATLWTFLVQPVIHSLKLEKSETPPRVWWCPTGPFAFLPIHAAGVYDARLGTPDDASKYMVSSYTPTLSSLLVPLAPPNADSFKMLVAIQPETEGQAPLAKTHEEMRQIERRASSFSLIKLGAKDCPPSDIDAVLSHLPHVSICHLACHGVQIPGDPLSSMLLLNDGPLKVSKIMTQSLPNASLAFLSACQTGTGDGQIPDEAMHLAATMLFAGFRGVVATMWSIADDDGPRIADTFYGHLLQGHEEGSAPDTTQAARALHLAVKRLREDHNNENFARWVPFVHYGL